MFVPCFETHSTRKPGVRPLGKLSLGLALSLALAGCGDDASGSGEASESQGESGESDTSGESASESGEETSESGETSEATEGSDLMGASLPQALGEAMYVNTTVYAQIPVHVAVDGQADAVIVSYDGNDYTATDDDGDSDWIALVDVSGIGMGDLTATATAAGFDDASATAQLVRGSDDLQMTDEDEVGPSTTPHIFTHDGRLFITYTDRVDGSRVVLQELDGAGRKVGSQIVLVPGTVGATNARIEANGDQIAVVYQTPTGTPYNSFFAIYNLEGAEQLAPMPLEDASMWSDGFGGDLEWDGEAYQIVHRINSGTGISQVEWLRITPSGDVTGPVVMAMSDGSDGMTGAPLGRFSANTFLKLSVLGDNTAVTWTRNHYVGLLDLDVQKGFVGGIDKDGNLLGDDVFASPDDFLWTWAFNVYSVHDRAIAVANVDDLSSPDVPAPTSFFAFAWDSADLDTPSIGGGEKILQDVDLREEAYVLEHPSQHATMLWIDHIQKSVSNDPGAPIELRVAPLAEDLTLGTPLVFPQARFFAGLAQLRGTPISTNVAMSWSDARRGFPSSETFIDFVWY